jgi:hypothetical protein
VRRPARIILGWSAKVARSSMMFNLSSEEQCLRRRTAMTKLIGVLVLFIALAAPAFAQEAKPTTDIRTEYLMTIEASLGHLLLSASDSS